MYSTNGIDMKLDKITKPHKMSKSNTIQRKNESNRKKSFLTMSTLLKFKNKMTKHSTTHSNTKFKLKKCGSSSEKSREKKRQHYKKNRKKCTISEKLHAVNKIFRAIAIIKRNKKQKKKTKNLK